MGLIHQKGKRLILPLRRIGLEGPHWDALAPAIKSPRTSGTRRLANSCPEIVVNEAERRVEVAPLIILKWSRSR